MKIDKDKSDKVFHETIEVNQALFDKYCPKTQRTVDAHAIDGFMRGLISQLSKNIICVALGAQCEDDPSVLNYTEHYAEKIMQQCGEELLQYTQWKMNHPTAKAF